MKPAEYDHEDYEEVEAAPPPPIGNWADELSDASPEHVIILEYLC